MLESLVLAAALASSSCLAPAGYAHRLTIESKPARQGESLAVVPIRGLSYISEEVPSRCIARWRVSGPARMSANHTRLAVATDARPGDMITVAFRLRRSREWIEQKLIVAGKEEVVLTGTYHQKSLERCTAKDSVGEFEFTDDGRFSVTYHPFETYRDYWGRYRFDALTGALTLTIENGNQVPTASDLDGKARFEGKRLVLDGFNLGGASANECLYRF